MVDCINRINSFIPRLPIADLRYQMGLEAGFTMRCRPCTTSDVGNRQSILPLPHLALSFQPPQLHSANASENRDPRLPLRAAPECTGCSVLCDCSNPAQLDRSPHPLSRE